MTAIPQRQSLVTQTVAFIRDSIQHGIWTNTLPSERILCENMQISRNTLRSALRELKRSGLISPRQGIKTQILTPAAKHPSRKEKQQPRDAAMLTPVPIGQMRPSQTLWIDALRAMLSEHGCRLHMYNSPLYFHHKTAAASLARLVSQNLHGCWILVMSSAACQRWFLANKIPCIAAGSVHDGMDLPFRDCNNHAVCRHAVATALRLGHRSLALVIPQHPAAGDIKSELGFFEGINTTSIGATGVVCSHDGSVGSIRRSLQRVMIQTPRPTMLLVSNAYHYLAVTSYLAQNGLRIPQDISVMCREEDPFFAYLSPRPSCYTIPPNVYAKNLLQPVIELINTGSVTKPSLLLLPKLSRGETIGAIPQCHRPLHGANCYQKSTSG